MPILTPGWRVRAARIRRGARARLVRLLPDPVRPAPRIRSYQDNDRVWRAPGTLEAITAPILRADALCSAVFGRDRVAALVDRWKATAAAPAQVIGALYVFETYHAGLGRALADASAKARDVARERQVVGRER